MKSPLEKRLDKLRDQQAQINEAIKKIETEKKQELRKIQKKKEALVGAMVMEMMAQGRPITIASESDLLALLDGFLVRKTDRMLFGFDEETVKTPANDSVPPAQTDEPQTEFSSKGEADVTEDVSESKDSDGKPQEQGKSRRSSSKRLPVGSKQKDMAEEFNM